MQKKILVLAVLVLGSLHLSQAVNAEDMSPTPISRDDIRKPLKEEREAMKKMIQEKRNEVKAKVQSMREQFKERLSLLRDERKKKRVENIDEKLQSINKRRTDHFITMLGRMTEILSNIETKVKEMKATGKDTTAADTAISEARTAIKVAQDAVVAQAAKEYTADITDETTLKAKMGEVIKKLQIDLQAVEKLVTAAKQSVMKAAMESAKLRGARPTQVPTGTVTNSPTLTP